MTTFTIDIPDNSTAEVLAHLEKLGVKIRRSKLSNLDNLTKEDYEKHFEHQAKATRNKVLKYL
jgi:preprotein translocase subunit Sec63